MRDLSAELEERFSESLSRNDQLHFGVEVYEAYCRPADEVIQEWPEDMLEHGDVVEYSGAAAGVLIKLQRNAVL